MFFYRRNKRKLQKEAEAEVARIGLEAAIRRVHSEMEANYKMFDGWREGNGAPESLLGVYGFEMRKLMLSQKRLRMYLKILESMQT